MAWTIARRIPPLLALACVAGAALRFATLDVQSLWYDEAVTAQLLKLDLSGLLHAIPDSESSPPLYYVLAWFWSQVFGTGEVGLRSLPALFGTAMIPVVWALGRRLGGDRAGLVAAALVAVNPMLVWFSQETRAYALLVLLGALAALLWLRALEQPRAGRAAAWGIVAALALATHYYAIFLVAPMALWLALRLPGVRPRAAALAPPLLALGLLAPLALHQRANDSAAFIGDSALATRLAQVPKQLLVGYDAPGETLIAVLSGLLLVAALAGLARLVSSSTAGTARSDTLADSSTAGTARSDALADSSTAGRARSDTLADSSTAATARAGALRLTALTAAALVLPAIASLAGEDHLVTRNLLAVAPLGAALVGAGLAHIERALPALGAAAIASACALGMVAVAGVATDERSQRDDWRGAVRALGGAPGQRLIVATPPTADAPLRYYLPSAHPIVGATATTNEVDYIAIAERGPGERPDPPRPKQPPEPAPGFALIAGVNAETYTVLRLRAPAPAKFKNAGATGLNGKGATLLAFTR